VLTSTSQRSFSFNGPKVWNRLPSAVRDGSLVTEQVHAAAEDLSVRTVIAHHPAPLRCFVILAPSINVLTYLLT